MAQQVAPHVGQTRTEDRVIRSKQGSKGHCEPPPSANPAATKLPRTIPVVNLLGHVQATRRYGTVLTAEHGSVSLWSLSIKNKSELSTVYPEEENWKKVLLEEENRRYTRLPGHYD